MLRLVSKEVLYDVEWMRNCSHTLDSFVGMLRTKVAKAVVEKCELQLNHADIESVERCLMQGIHYCQQNPDTTKNPANLKVDDAAIFVCVYKQNIFRETKLLDSLSVRSVHPRRSKSQET